MTSMFTRVKYQVEIYIGNYLVPQNLLTGMLSYNKTTGQTTTLTFTLLNRAGVQDPEGYVGKQVAAYIQTHQGRFKFFTGWVNTPSIDLIEEKTTLTCSDRRSFRIKNLSQTSATFSGISSVGQYSTVVFGTPKDDADELDRRLQTVPYDFDFDNNGSPQLTSWVPKSTADFVLTDSPGPYYDNKIYYDKPEVTFSDPSSRINTFNITFDHQYTRLIQQTCLARWNGYTSLRDWFYGSAGRPGKGSFPAKTTIESAANGGSWVVYGKINFTELWPSQGIDAGFGGGVIIWQPNSVSTTYAPKTDLNGNPVTDINGNVQQSLVSSSITDTSSYLCRGATWTAVRKFTQPVIEHFTISVTAPSSINQFQNLNISEESYNITSDYDSSDWTNDKNVIIGSSTPSYIDKRVAVSDVQNGLLVCIEKAKVAIMKSHRDCEVTFNRSIFPQCDVTHTIELDADMISCKGRVTSVTHNINFLTQEAVTSIRLTLSRCRNQDTMSQTSIVPTINDSYDYIGTGYTIFLGTHLAVNPDLASTYGWNGFIGNAELTTYSGNNTLTYRTTYGESFTVDYPAIPDIITKQRDLYRTNSYTVQIPNNPLVIRSNVYSE